MKHDTEFFKVKLDEELKTLEEELKTVGRINPSNPADWEAVPSNVDIDSADENELADKIEFYEDNSAILKQLEIQYNNVKKALAKISDGKYGICEVCGEAIEKARLEANPSAKTCKEDSLAKKN
ncbi:MAG: TraR/DksA C4-type zinc finger protein [Candidatus Taylorbacteria bacterium]|nr:TraR/DksA C4-type zinc finger protein [Candidatus Taylorbacteria bacterium]